MIYANVTLEDVEEAIRANCELQAELKRRCERLRDALGHISAARVFLCKRSHAVTRRRRLASRRDPLSTTTGPLFLQNYFPCGRSLGAFRDAGIYAEEGIPRYATIPPTADEARWQEALREFPPIPLNESTAAARSWSNEEDDALIAAVRGYAGNHCGPSFWRSLALPGKSPFDVASRYVSLRMKRTLNHLAARELPRQVTKDEKITAAQWAVYRHLGDSGGMFAAYVDSLSEAARRCSYMAEVAGDVPVPFPPYVWEKRMYCMQDIELVVREASVALVPCDLEMGDEVPLSQKYRKRAQRKPSFGDLAACLLALKGEVFGEKSSLQVVVQIFLPHHETSGLTLRDIMRLKIGPTRKRQRVRE